jgi:hypothetical protein
VIVGTFRAWKVRVDTGVVKAPLEAVVRVSQMGGCGEWSKSMAEWWGELGDDGCGERWSFVAAIWVRSEASSLRRSVEG